MPRRGELKGTVAGPFPGDEADPRGFPVLWAAYETHMAARGYTPATIRTRRHAAAQLAIWLADRGITRPSEVTREVLERYQRHLYYHRKPDGQPLLAASQGTGLWWSLMVERRWERPVLLGSIVGTRRYVESVIADIEEYRVERGVEAANGHGQG